MTQPTWRKSRRSVNNANCVELNNHLTQLRDSKNPTGPTLQANLPALLHAIRTNHLGS